MHSVQIVQPCYSIALSDQNRRAGKAVFIRVRRALSELSGRYDVLSLTPFVWFERVSLPVRNAHYSVEDTAASDERPLRLGALDSRDGSPVVRYTTVEQP